ncbi:MAG: hypothetical protein K2Y32_17615 [Candidatus Obscuribacterales bacterium]|nr:hypothetical protein [Candidatus Obscuribacterales bacterium]
MMSTIQQAVSESTRLLSAWQEKADRLDENERKALVTQLKTLFSEELGRRGFFAAYSTSDLQLTQTMKESLKAAVIDNIDAVGDIMVKNIFMSGQSFLLMQRHAQGNIEDKRKAEASRQTMIKSLDLVQGLGLDEIKNKLEDALLAIDSYQEENENPEAKWHQFFKRWNYKRENLERMPDLLNEA